VLIPRQLSRFQGGDRRPNSSALPITAAVKHREKGRRKKKKRLNSQTPLLGRYSGGVYELGNRGAPNISALRRRRVKGGGEKKRSTRGAGQISPNPTFLNPVFKQRCGGGKGGKEKNYANACATSLVVFRCDRGGGREGKESSKLVVLPCLTLLNQSMIMNS